MLTFASKRLYNCYRSLASCPLPPSFTGMAKMIVQQNGNPFADLKISSWEPLKGVDGRAECPECKRSRKFFCYTCYRLVGLSDPAVIPRVRLPLKVDILKHPLERVGKSTAVHARVLAPDDVTMYIHPNIPTYTDTSKLLLLFPKKMALTTAEAAQMMRDSSQLPGAGSDQSGASVDPNPWSGLDRLVVIDSTWNGTNAILKDERVKDLPCVKLSEAETHFWRPQRRQDSKHLATIEAIYYFFREMNELINGRSYSGIYDNLLYFYAYQYGVVQQAQKKRLEEL
ncbi:tRNA-uridine aminocarboxypropyltransferase 1-like isoform X2 [Halichondria panicea]|uniref:tRNA-uridine aminocarboxypropyltransferase 1-like isoform X2 n=1 Tax=Halichondria panicea TaxID=6063 RepID=UPI00312B7959